MLDHLKLIDEMERAGLPETLDQDARDLHRFIREHAWRYEVTEFGNMTMRLARSLHRLVQSAATSAPDCWMSAVTEMVEAYGEMEKGIEDPILCHYNGTRLHNAMENLRALVLPNYTPRYEPSVSQEDAMSQEEIDEGALETHRAKCSP